MRIKLYAMPNEAENIDAPLVEVIPPAPLASSTDFMGLWVFYPLVIFTLCVHVILCIIIYLWFNENQVFLNAYVLWKFWCYFRRDVVFIHQLPTHLENKLGPMLIIYLLVGFYGSSLGLCISLKFVIGFILLWYLHCLRRHIHVMLHKGYENFESPSVDV